MPVEGAKLHDQLSEAYDKTVGATDTATSTTAATDTTSGTATDTTTAAADTQAADQRARDEAGLFVKQDEKAKEPAKAGLFSTCSRILWWPWRTFPVLLV